ncbi:MAG: winged helix-turn-helix transcriptional regulator, partial [Euryarchaeota archaeon]|nr:winged helix-turn-helix transcriptional regulator [Euryarchaeota archaeon]
GMIEGYGTGILRIRKYIEERGLVQPEFRDYEGFFKVVFYNTEPDDGEVEKVDGEVEKVDGEVEKVDGEVEKLTEHQKTILHLIKKDPSISKKEMSETVGIRPSSIDKNIATLKDKQYLRRVGPAKGGHWELTRKLD